MVFTPDGDTLISAAGDGSIRFWRAASFAEVNAADTTHTQLSK